MSRKLDDARVDLMRRLWGSGATAPDLAAQFGVSAGHVWRVCAPRLFGRPDIRRERAAARSASRAADREAARERAALRRRGTADRDAEIRRLWALGFPGVDLAERFGLSRARVSEICAGMPSRRRYGDPRDVAYPFPRRLAEALEALALRHSIPPSGEVLPALDARRLGSANGRSKLLERDIARMKELRASGWTYPALSREFQVSRSNVWYILSGSTWSGVSTPSPETGGEPS